MRQALQWAFDRKTDNKVAWGGAATDTWNPFEKTPYYIGQDVAGRGRRRASTPTRRRACSRRRAQSNLKLNMMILKEPGPWKRESEVLQQGFKKAGINATIQVAARRRSGSTGSTRSATTTASPSTPARSRSRGR